MTERDGADDTDRTMPPVTALRFATAPELYAAIPQLREMTQNRPRPEETCLHYLERLAASTTPEEAVTLTAFAATPKMAIWWAYECLRTAPGELSAADRDLLELVAMWTTHPEPENRFRVMRMALFAPIRSPAVFLGLAVGWSGGPVAPNDPAPVPTQRTPRAINSSVLSCLAKADLSGRSRRLAQFIKLAERLYRLY